jgi:hypothetical protein
MLVAGWHYGVTSLANNVKTSNLWRDMKNRDPAIYHSINNRWKPERRYTEKAISSILRGQREQARDGLVKVNGSHNLHTAVGSVNNGRIYHRQAFNK